MAESRRMPSTARSAVFLLAVLLFTTACLHMTPAAAKVSNAPGNSARVPVQLVAPGVGADGLQRIQITGPDSARVTAIARVIASTLKRQPRVANADSIFTAAPLDAAGAQFALNVSYEFRGPAKLADSVRMSIALDAKVPDGYKVLASAAPRGG